MDNPMAISNKMGRSRYGNKNHKFGSRFYEWRFHRPFPRQYLQRYWESRPFQPLHRYKRFPVTYRYSRICRITDQKFGAPGTPIIVSVIYLTIVLINQMPISLKLITIWVFDNMPAVVGGGGLIAVGNQVSLVIGG